LDPYAKKSLNEVVQVLAKLGIRLESGDKTSSLVGDLSDEDVKVLIRRVDELEFSARVVKGLRREGCAFVFQAVERICPGVGKLGPKGLKAWPHNFGWKSYSEFADVVKELGLQTGMRFTDAQRAELLRLAQEKTANIAP
jgi:DNA-directed RNA polymerase alpha subunit